MTIKAKNRTLLAAAIVAVAALAATLLPMVASTELDPRRDIHLVIRDMAFYLDGKGDANPTLHFRRGERVRVILTSEDTGMHHDFVVSGWKVATKTIRGRGEQKINFKIPREAGSETYFCTPHAEKMRGTILIE